MLLEPRSPSLIIIDPFRCLQATWTQRGRKIWLCPYEGFGKFSWKHKLMVNGWRHPFWVCTFIKRNDRQTLDSSPTLFLKKIRIFHIKVRNLSLSWKNSEIWHHWAHILLLASSGSSCLDGRECVLPTAPHPPVLGIFLFAHLHYLPGPGPRVARRRCEYFVLTINPGGPLWALHPCPDPLWRRGRG